MVGLHNDGAAYNNNTQSGVPQLCWLHIQAASVGGRSRCSYNDSRWSGWETYVVWWGPGIHVTAGT
jgi:hypothetical protein